MEYTEEELRLLAGAEFNALLAADPELQRLQSLTFDKAAESRVLLELLGCGTLHIGKISVLPLTAAKWSFLWLLDSPFVTGGEVKREDVDLMLYILSAVDLREIPCAMHELPAAASGMSSASTLPVKEVIAEIQSMIRTAFLPLAMMPAPEKSTESPYYDSVWAAGIAGLAARESGMNFLYCLHKMPLSALCAFFVNYRRREGSESEQIRRRVPEEVSELISARIETLSEEFLKKHRPGG